METGLEPTLTSKYYRVARLQNFFKTKDFYQLVKPKLDRFSRNRCQNLWSSRGSFFIIYLIFHIMCSVSPWHLCLPKSIHEGFVNLWSIIGASNFGEWLYSDGTLSNLFAILVIWFTKQIGISFNLHPLARKVWQIFSAFFMFLEIVLSACYAETDTGHGPVIILDDYKVYVWFSFSNCLVSN